MYTNSQESFRNVLVHSRNSNTALQYRRNTPVRFQRYVRRSLYLSYYTSFPQHFIFLKSNHSSQIYANANPCTEPQWLVALPDLHILLRLQHHFDDMSRSYRQKITNFQNQHYVQLCTVTNDRAGVGEDPSLSFAASAIITIVAQQWSISPSPMRSRQHPIGQCRPFSFATYRHCLPGDGTKPAPQRRPRCVSTKHHPLRL